MSISRRVAADPWVRGWGASGALMLAGAAIGGLPWLLWAGWAYLGVLAVADARGAASPDHPGGRTRRCDPHHAPPCPVCGTLEATS